MQAQLADPFAVEDEPFVVPVWEQVAVEQPQLWKQRRAVLAVAGVVTYPVGRLSEHAKVEAHIRMQCARRLVGDDDRRANLTQAPQRRRQLCWRPVLLLVEPEVGRDVNALERAVVERDKRDEA